jgi:hypothetical protein
MLTLQHIPTRAAAVTVAPRPGGYQLHNTVTTIIFDAFPNHISNMFC